MTDYTFKPWTIQDGRCVLSHWSVWDELETLEKGAKGLGIRPRVLLDCDPFVAFDGPIVDAGGSTLYCIGASQFVTCNPPQFFLVEREPATFADVVARLFALIDATPNLRWRWLADLPRGPAIENEGAITSDEDYLEGTPVPCRDEELSHELTCMIGRLAAIQCDYGLNTQACIDALVALRAELYELETETSEQ